MYLEMVQIPNIQVIQLYLNKTKVCTFRTILWLYLKSKYMCPLIQKCFIKLVSINTFNLQD